MTPTTVILNSFQDLSPKRFRIRSGMTVREIPDQVRNDTNYRHPELVSGSRVWTMAKRFRSRSGMTPTTVILNSFQDLSPKRFRIRSGMTVREIPDQVRNDGAGDSGFSLMFSLLCLRLRC